VEILHLQVSKFIWFQTPCHEQGHLPLDQVAQSSSNQDLNTSREGTSKKTNKQKYKNTKNKQKNPTKKTILTL